MNCRHYASIRNATGGGFSKRWGAGIRNSAPAAIWVFVKVKPAGQTAWQHLRLTADRVFNPSGYGQAGGRRLEFLAPAGDNGFTGVFIRRAEFGQGMLSATGVTVTVDLTSVKDLEFAFQNAEPVWIERIQVFAHPDVMIREFEKGVVLVNPSDRPYTFDLENLMPGKR